MAEEWNVHLCVLGLGLAGVAFWLPFRTTQKTLKTRHTHFYLASADLRHHRLQDGWGLQAFVFAIDGAHLLSDFFRKPHRGSITFFASVFPGPHVAPRIQDGGSCDRPEGFIFLFLCEPKVFVLHMLLRENLGTCTGAVTCQ